MIGAAFFNPSCKTDMHFHLPEAEAQVSNEGPPHLFTDFVQGCILIAFDNQIFMHVTDDLTMAYVRMA